jgi:hypothetical protein
MVLAMTPFPFPCVVRGIIVAGGEKTRQAVKSQYDLFCPVFIAISDRLT